METVEITPKSYPSNLIDKDWSKRKLYFKSPAKDFPDLVHDMEVRSDDVWIVTFPKCGTTWMQELLWLLINDCNFEAALSEHLEVRSPFLEFDFFINADSERALKPVTELQSPRLIKSHLSLALLPAQLWTKKPKLVYVFRNPKDAWVSSYYHGVNSGFNYGKTLDQFLNEYLEEKVQKQAPIAHASEFYQLRNEPWVYYTSFERMKSNLRSVIEDLCQFLNKTITEEQMQRMLKHLSFEEMKNNPKTNHLWEQAQIKHKDKDKEKHNFVRRGKVNGYKDELTPELIEKADCCLNAQLDEHGITLDEHLLLSAVEVSTFLALSSLEEGPVCVICTKRSVEGGGSFFMGAVIVSRPSEESDDVTVSGLTSPSLSMTSRHQATLLLFLCLLLPEMQMQPSVEARLTKRSYSDQSVHGYMTERTCWWNEACKEEFQSLFRCKCPQFSYCRSPGRYYNAYCSMTDTGYIWTQPNWDWGP
ncbi:estrogen sulfotransferase [Scaptodrosophila lebanonensis]|uniref:Estrogen sulfotransferase n=1 Tax=Drosophila lebanonensis TaxID=7225 RepID=A0A6J2UJG4_DROLE|nr:estrogen sulfotransferase [Scaptodrosophila lebanonensis]